MFKFLIRSITCMFCMLMLVVNGGNAFGQTEDFPTEATEVVDQPPMKNIFMNVLWGSISGGAVMMSWAILDDELGESERYKLSHLQTQFIVGATYGGLIGLGIGVFLSMKGMTFDEERTRIAFMPPPVYDRSRQEQSALGGPAFINDHRQTLVDLQIKF